MKYNIQNLDEYLFDYIIKWVSMIYDEKLNILDKTVIVFLHFIHVLIIIFNVIGAFLPPKLLKIYIIFTLFLVSSWYIFGKCMVLYYTYQIDKRDYDFLPLNHKTRISILSFFFIWAIIGINIPDYSLFRISKLIINTINNYVNYIKKTYD